GFAYDNETPRHRVLVPAHAMATHPVTNAEYSAFVADGGYDTASLWLSDGWDLAHRPGLGVDVQRVRALPRLPPARGHAGRIQRQVHERPAGAPRRQLRHAAGTCPPDLPQLLRTARALAVLRPAPCKGSCLSNDLTITDLHPSVDDITGDVLRGLSATPKHLPSKYFYDQRGYELFEAITRQPEYYPTRVELALLADCGPRIAAAVGPRAHVVEYGSGSGRKTRLLLDALEDPVAYTPIEI